MEVFRILISITNVAKNLEKKKVIDMLINYQ